MRLRRGDWGQSLLYLLVSVMEAGSRPGVVAFIVMEPADVVVCRIARPRPWKVRCVGAWQFSMLLTSPLPIPRSVAGPVISSVT